MDSWTPTQQNALQKQQDYPDFPADSDLDYIQRKYSQNDNYQKPVYELQVYNPMNHGQLDIPEGPLEPWIGEEEVLEMGNNYCNNNGYAIPQVEAKNTVEWLKMEPIPAVPSPVAMELESPIASIDAQLDDYRRKEKAKGYSSKCLKNKKLELEHNKERFENLTSEKTDIVSKNLETEKLLHFACDRVLIPFLGDNNSNNSNIGTEDVISFLHNLEVEKNKIWQKSLLERQKDDTLVVAEKLQNIKKRELDVATYNKDNKKEMAEREKVSQVTFATRHNRVKMDFETIHYNYEAKVLEYDIRIEAEKNMLFGYYWSLFVPHAREIPGEFWEKAYNSIQNPDQMIQFQELRNIIFNPG